VRACPSVGAILIGEGGQRASGLEQRAGIQVYVRASHSLGLEEHEMLPMTRAQASRSVRVYSKGEEIMVDHFDVSEATGQEDRYGWSEGYRVLVEGGKGGEKSCTVVLGAAGDSFGRGHVKGAEKMPPKAKETKAGEQPRPGRRRSRGKRKREGAGQVGAAEEVQKPPQAPSADKTPGAKDAVVASPTVRRGLLRRGARRLGGTAR